MNNNPQYIVIIEVISDRTSKSLSTIVLKGCFFKFIIKNKIRIKNIMRAYATTPKLLMKIAEKIIAIFLYMITISQ